MQPDAGRAHRHCKEWAKVAVPHGQKGLQQTVKADIVLDRGQH
jgi:hypothetical protein